MSRTTRARRDDEDAAAAIAVLALAAGAATEMTQSARMATLWGRRRWHGPAAAAPAPQTWWASGLPR